MLDRLISGAGAVTDAADRLVRALVPGRGSGALGHRPASVVVALGCAVLAAFLVLAGLEATDDPTASAMTPDRLAKAGDLGGRMYATVAGSIAATYVETFTDDNGNGKQDSGETGISWFYFLVDPATKSGIAVRSKTPPAEIYRWEGTGVIVQDATYLTEDIRFFAEEATSQKFSLDPGKFLDTTAAVASTPPLFDLATALPAADTPVHIAGSRTASYLEGCTDDTNGDGVCSGAEVNQWDIGVFDEASGKGITVVVDRDPEYTAATFTGMLRRDEHAVNDAKTTGGFDFSTLGLDVSDVYLLDADAAPANAPAAFGLAALSALAAGVILAGLAGGYLVFRGSADRLPPPAATLAIGERIPVRVTGDLRSATGLVHVREASADLVRFQTSGPSVVPPPAAPAAPAPAAPAAPMDSALAASVAAAGADAVQATLIVERRDRPEGVAIGSRELTALSSGDVLPLHGRRAAIRAMAGTGRLLLSFDSAAERDRALAALLEETGLADDSGMDHA